MSSMPKAWARCATSEPARPRPTTPSTLPCSSTPSHFERSQRPATSAACAWGMLRAWASSSAMACSATERMFDVGALTTMTPRSVAAVDVDVVEADAGPADHRADVAGRQHVGGDLGGGADDQRLRARDRLEQLLGASPSRTSTSWPASASRSSPLCAIFSVTSTRATAVVSFTPPRPAAFGQSCASANSAANRDTPSTRSSSAQGVGHAEVARRAERLSGHDRHLGLVDADFGQLRAARRTLSPERPPEQPLDRGDRRRTRPPARRTRRPRCR